MKFDERELLFILKQVEDPRHKRGVRYSFSDLLLMCIYAVLAGRSEASEIAFYTELNLDYFKALLGIEKAPSHDTFSRLMRMVNFESLSVSLWQWLSEMYPDLCQKYNEKKVLHIDGKAVRAASEKGNGEGPRYLLNAMYEGESIGLKLKEVGEKENEISCLPSYLELFDLKDTIVTIDAIGCNQTVLNKITESGGDYVVPVKENQKKLLKAIEEKIEELKTSGEYEKLDSTEQLTKEHGRIEKIKATLITDTSFIYERLKMKSFYGSIARIGVIEKEILRKQNGEEAKSKTRQIMITSLEAISIENLLKIKRAHWNIEMQHWLLDVQLNEDQKTARKNNAMINGSVLRRFCMMMKKHDESYAEKPMKRFLMANEHDIHRVEQLLFGTEEIL